MKIVAHINGWCMFVFGSALILLGQTPFVLAQTYTLTGLGTLPGGTYNSEARSINNLGQVVGYSSVSGGEEAFIWDPVNGMVSLGGTYSIGNGINNAGQVAGYYMAPGVGQAYIWDSTNGMVGLGGYSSWAYDINDSSQIVGHHRYTQTQVYENAFIWDSTNGIQDIGILTGVDSKAWAINNYGQVAGQSDSTQGTQAFIWDSVNGMVGLGALNTGSAFFSRAYDINDVGEVVGESIGLSGGYEAFMWDAVNGMVGLGRPLGSDTEARGINNLGQVVGWGNGDLGAFIWDADNGIVSLNSLVDASGAGWNLVTAYDINDLGQIVGLGYNSKGSEAFLLTPVPEPTSLLLLGTGLAGMMGLRKKRKK